MSVQVAGTKYLISYGGLLKIAEEVLNIATLISAATCGYALTTYTINFIGAYAFLCTMLFLVVHVKSWNLKVDLPWYWMECLNCLTIVLIYFIASGVVLSEMTKAFIITGVFGFITAMVYGLDAMDKFKLALTPRKQYVWSTPNMPL